jgi:hypothetical protein
MNAISELIIGHHDSNFTFSPNLLPHVYTASIYGSAIHPYILKNPNGEPHLLST